MTDIEKVTYEERYRYSFVPPGYSSSLIQLKTVNKRSNDFGSRVKPKILLKNLTGYSASKSLVVQGIITQVPKNGVNWFNPDTSQYEKLYPGDNIPFTTVGAEGVPALNPSTALRIREKLEGRRLNLGAYIAEYAETIALFKGSARGIYRAYQLARGQRRIRVGRARRPLDLHDVSAAHLNAHFAFKPLINDLISGSFLLDEQVAEPIQCRDVATDAKSVNVTTTRPDGLESRTRFTHSLRTMVYSELSVKAHNTPKIGNPLEWAWEATPASFVVDWMVDIGGWLNSLDALEGFSNVRVVNINRRKYLRGTYNQREYRPEYSVTRPSTRFDVFIERTIGSAVPIPPLPTYDPSKSLLTLAHATALLHQLGVKRKSHRDRYNGSSNTDWNYE